MRTDMKASITIIVALVFATATMAVPPQVRMFTEHPPKDQSDITKAMLTQPAYVFGHSWFPKSIDQQGDEAVAYLKTLPPGYRAICWADWWFTPLFFQTTPEHWAQFGYDVPMGDPLKDFQAGISVNYKWEVARIKKTVDKLKAANIILDFSYFDFEAGYSAWGFPDTDATKVIVADPTARRRFTATLRTATPDKKPIGMFDQGGREFITAYGAQCMKVNFNTMKTVFDQSGLSKQSTVIVNFEYRRQGVFTVYDSNGWPVGGPSAFDWTLDAAHTSCPSVYLPNLANDGWFHCRYPPVQLKKDQLWVALCEELNELRSLTAQGPCVPVVSTCWWSTDRAIATELLIAHALRTGITTYDLWNSCQDDGQELAIAQMLGRHYRYASENRLSLPEIPLDADQIDTNGYVTTYTEFMSKISTVRPK